MVSVFERNIQFSQEVYQRGQGEGYREVSVFLCGQHRIANLSKLDLPFW